MQPEIYKDAPSCMQPEIYKDAPACMQPEIYQFAPSCLVCSQIWLNLPGDDHHFGCMEKFPKTYQLFSVCF
jgi:hypothetical protein